MPPVYERVLEVVRQIPRGQVATYGQIAQIVGGCTPRLVGFCLASTGPISRGAAPRNPVAAGHQRPGQDQPPRRRAWGALLQRELLEEEGVEFSDAGRVSFRAASAGWTLMKPTSNPARRSYESRNLDRPARCNRCGNQDFSRAGSVAWWGRRDSNPHAQGHMILSHARAANSDTSP